MLDFDCTIFIRPPHLISAFSVEKKGRFARFKGKPDPMDGTRVAVEMTGPITNAQRREVS